MKRLLTLAALVVGFSLIASTSEAGDRFRGGHGVHHGHHGGHGYSHSGYGRSAYSNYGHGGYYGGQSYGYGNGYGNGYQPRFQSGYTPRYRSYNGHQRGGLRVDVGRLHFGYGGHH
jgi:hypothetical protein